MLRRLLIPDPGTLCALAVGIPAAFSKLISFDLFFNIASGRWILAHGFPTKDPFSLTAAGTWFPHEWGYGVMAALSVDSFGGRGPAILTALILTAGIMVLYQAILLAYKRAGLIPLALLLLALAAQAFSWQAQRGYQLGNLLFVVTVWLVFRFRQGPDRLIWLFVPVCLLWANLHGSWLAGPALLGAAAIGMAVDGRAPLRAWLTAAGIAALGVLSAAASPRGFSTCLYPLGFLAEGQGHSIMEWHSMDLSLGWEKMVLVLLALFIAALVRERKRNLALLIPAGGLTAAAVLAERFVPMAAAFLAVACAELLSSTEFSRTGPLARAVQRMDEWLTGYGRRAGGAIWGLAAVAGVMVYAGVAPLALEQNLHPGFFPVESLTALADRPPGRVLNRYRFGGAVSALAGPGHKVFIDGRNDLYPGSIHEDYRRLVLLEPGWRDILVEYRPDYILWSNINRGEELTGQMKLDEEFDLVAEDPVGMLFVRKPPLEDSRK